MLLKKVSSICSMTAMISYVPTVIIIRMRHAVDHLLF